MERDYDVLAARPGTGGTRLERMRAFVDAAWEALAPSGVSWIGFYLHEGGAELVLGPRRDKPACSPIGLHGACGQAFRNGEPLVVRDVADLGENYVACDPRDRSEIVIPLFDEMGRVWGVLDADSHEPGAFSQADVEGLRRCLLKAGLTSR
jgi:putative methionine-R-sulfoxide reductase with GAF domain